MKLGERPGPGARVSGCAWLSPATGFLRLTQLGYFESSYDFLVTIPKVTFNLFPR